jgi:hypothetical protein
VAVALHFKAHLVVYESHKTLQDWVSTLKFTLKEWVAQGIITL